MEDGRIAKDLLYRELELGSRLSYVRFSDVCKREMLATGLPTDNWELIAVDRVKWKTTCRQAFRAGEKKLKAGADIKIAKRKAAARVAASARAASGFICGGCGRVCRLLIGFHHQGKCSQVR